MDTMLRQFCLLLWRFKAYQKATWLSKAMGMHAARQGRHAEDNPFAARRMRCLSHITKGVDNETIFYPDDYWSYERTGIHDYLASSWFYGFGLGIWERMHIEPNRRDLNLWRYHY